MIAHRILSTAFAFAVAAAGSAAAAASSDSDAAARAVAASREEVAGPGLLVRADAAKDKKASPGKPGRKPAADAEVLEGGALPGRQRAEPEKGRGEGPRMLTAKGRIRRVGGGGLVLELENGERLRLDRSDDTRVSGQKKSWGDLEAGDQVNLQYRGDVLRQVVVRGTGRSADDVEDDAGGGFWPWNWGRGNRDREASDAVDDADSDDDAERRGSGRERGREERRDRGADDDDGD